MPPRTLAGIQQAVDRQGRQLTRREVRTERVVLASMLALVVGVLMLIGFTGNFLFLGVMGGPIGGLIGSAAKDVEPPSSSNPWP